LLSFVQLTKDFLPFSEIPKLLRSQHQPSGELYPLIMLLLICPSFLGPYINHPSLLSSFSSLTSLPFSSSLLAETLPPPSSHHHHPRRTRTLLRAHDLQRRTRSLHDRPTIRSFNLDLLLSPTSFATLQTSRRSLDSSRNQHPQRRTSPRSRSARSSSSSSCVFVVVQDRVRSSNRIRRRFSFSFSFDKLVKTQGILEEAEVRRG